MDYDNILFEVNNGIGTITINRPKEMNSLNLETIQELSSAVDECEDSADVRVIVLTGSNNVFSAGDDIKIMNMARTKTEIEVSKLINEEGYPSLIRKMMSSVKPIIGSINGICYGAAGELALACDYVLASDKASFGQLYIKLGLIGNTFLLPKHVGIKKAIELIWTGEIIKAEDALNLGMLNKVVKEEELQAQTEKIAGKFAKGPTKAYGLAKKAVYEGFDLNIDSSLTLMTKMQGSLMKSKDHQEGVMAFLEKRKAVYKGE